MHEAPGLFNACADVLLCCYTAVLLCRVVSLFRGGLGHGYHWIESEDRFIFADSEINFGRPLQPAQQVLPSSECTTSLWRLDPDAPRNATSSASVSTSQVLTGPSWWQILTSAQRRSRCEFWLCFHCCVSVSIVNHPWPRAATPTVCGTHLPVIFQRMWWLAPRVTVTGTTE